MTYDITRRAVSHKQNLENGIFVAILPLKATQKCTKTALSNNETINMRENTICDFCVNSRF